MAALIFLHQSLSSTDLQLSDTTFVIWHRWHVIPSISTIYLSTAGITPAFFTYPDGLCNCRAPLPAFGYFQLNCSKWAGRSWKRGHDVAVKVLVFEIRRLGMGAVASDFTMKKDYAHTTSTKRGDVTVTSDGHLQPTNAVDRHHD